MQLSCLYGRQVPQFLGYSTGKWIDEDGDGDVLEVDARGLKGPRVYDTSSK
jgi:hypothetical protein